VQTDTTDPRTAGHGGPGHSGRAHRPVRSWPLLVLALPASVAVWSGWVGIGEMTGFGLVRPLPGIWDSLQINTAVTLPVGVEAYAAMALRAWLGSSDLISERTRRFAKWSAIGALLLGAAGQVAYHLLAEAHVTRAPWMVTILVGSLPVLVLGLGTALAHMLRSDATATRPMFPVPGPVTADQAPSPGPPETGATDQDLAACTAPDDVQAAEAALLAAGGRVSRRSLRAAGARGSNAALGELARRLRAHPQV
jgi:hypothetical protein